MKGIILAAGKGTRLYPITKVVNKQLLPLYDKPMIYYPLCTLMMAGIKDILIITSVDDKEIFSQLFGNGSQWGINISYEVQIERTGTVAAFHIGKEFIKDDDCALIFGDNIFCGHDLTAKLEVAVKNVEDNYATVFGYEVDDPKRFGVIELDGEGNVISIEEKPEVPKSNNASTGLYFYPKDVMEKVPHVQMTNGEYWMPDLLNMFREENRLKAVILEKEYKWFDTGTFESLLDAAGVIKEKQQESGSLICSPEKTAYEKGWITKEQLSELAQDMAKNSYGEKLNI